jgi:hypothetical protein
MKSPIRLLRVAYWFGAVFDGAMLIPLLLRRAAASMLGLDRFAPGADYRYAAAVAAALMAGWTALLVWGVLRPVERRGVLLLTACPVVFGLIAAGIYAVVSGLVRLPYMLPIFAFQAVGCALFITAYARAAAFERTAAGADRHSVSGAIGHGQAGA